MRFLPALLTVARVSLKHSAFLLC